MPDGSTLELLLREVLNALVAPRRFARALRDEHEGLSTLFVTIAAGATLATVVDLMAIAAGDRPVAPGTVVVDALLFGARVAIVVALAAAVCKAATRLAKSDVPLSLAFAAVGFGTAPLLLVWAALAPALVGLWMAALALGTVVIVWCFALTALDLAAVIPGRRAIVAAALAIPIVAYGLADRLVAASVFATTMDPSLVPELPARPAAGTAYEVSALTITLPADWRRASTTNDMARFEREIEALRVVRVRPRELDTILTGADDLLTGAARGVDVRLSERRLWRSGSDLVVEDVRSGIYEERELTFVLYTRRTAQGVVGLLFHVVGRAELDDLLDRYRPIAVSLTAR